MFVLDYTPGEDGGVVLHGPRGARFHVEMPRYFFVRPLRARWDSVAAAKLFLVSAVMDRHASSTMSAVVKRRTVRDPAFSYYAQLVFTGEQEYRSARASMRREFMLLESGVDPIIRLLHVSGAPAFGAWDVRGSDFRAVGPSSSSATGIGDLVVASFDIECISGDRGRFPNPSHPDDAVICIATAFQRGGRTEETTVLCLGEAVLRQDTEIDDLTCYATEVDLLNAWFRLLEDKRVTFLTGWNIFGFDNKYIDTRATTLVDDETASPLVDMRGFALRTKVMNSSGFGENTYNILDKPGVIAFDMMHFFKQNTTNDSYSLNSIAEKYLGRKKIDLSIAEMFDKYDGGDPGDRGDIVEYCARDVHLPLELMRMFNVVERYVEMANASMVPVKYVIERGQSVKVWSLFLKTARDMHILIPDVAKSANANANYEGATVLSAETGAYLDGSVAVFDFASLYPSIVRAYNVCPSTKTLSPGDADEKVVVDSKVLGYRQHPRGILPTILDDLIRRRKDARREKVDADLREDRLASAVCEARQLAFKVLSNSVYGFFGAVTSYFPDKDVAASITTIGRRLILTAKTTLEAVLPGTRVVYGDTDSCFLWTAEADMPRVFRSMDDALPALNAAFKAPIEMEFEKVFAPFLLFSKKRYAGIKFTSADDPGRIEFKGIQLARRDNAPVVKKLSQELLDCILVRKSFDGAVDAAVAYVERMLRGEFDIQDFVISKSIRSNYANPTALPHVVVADKIFRRTGERVQMGTRIPYVFVLEQLGEKQAAAADDPAHVLAANQTLDVVLYFDSQMRGPIDTFLGLCDGAIMAFDDRIRTVLDEARKKRDRWIAQARNKRQGQREITSFFK